MTEREYECESCGKKQKSKDESHPNCCDKPMKQIPLDACTQPHDAEYSGPFEEDEPCDDNRAGIKK